MNRKAALKKYQELCLANVQTQALPDHSAESPDALWSHFKPCTEVIDMSPRLETLIGDIRGKRWIEMLPLSERVITKTKIASVKKGRGFTNEARVLCQDGKTRIFQFHNTPHYDNDGSLRFIEGRAEICEVIPPDIKN